MLFSENIFSSMETVGFKKEMANAAGKTTLEYLTFLKEIKNKNNRRQNLEVSLDSDEEFFDYLSFRE
jgi:hypothetical protein